MKVVEEKMISRIRIVFNSRSAEDSKAAIAKLTSKFGEGRFVYAVGHGNNPNESILTAEGV